MLTKLSTFRGVAADSGEPLVRVFHQGDSIQKVAGYYQPEVRDFLRTYKSDKNEIALLVNAMGGSEYWGQNVNGDVFPWDRLSHDCTGRDPESYPFDKFYGKKVRPYGFKTFLQAHAFAHHKNQDPNRAFGHVVVACLNELMKRVELVVIVERDKAEKFDASHIISKIDAGQFPDVSMGCRIPYDVCTICGNKSRTKDDLCSCVKDLGLNYIFPDGRKVGLINLHPVFFDISFVFIGADRTAKVMEKLAGAGTGVVPSAIEAEYVYVCNNGRCGLEKRASIVVPEHIITDAQVHDQGRGQTLLTKLRESRADGDNFNALIRELMRPLLQQVAERENLDGTGLGDGLLHTNVQTQADDMSVEKRSGACCVGKTTCGCNKNPDEVMDPNQQGPAGHQNNVGSSAMGGAGGMVKEGEDLDLAKPPHRDEFPFQGKRKFKGLTVLVENAAGTWRTGKGWATKMQNDYGEIEGSLGSDGDAVDVYLGPNEDSNKVFIVHQNYVYGPKKGEYDEDKVMLGFSSSVEAKRVYLKHYDRPEFFRSITEMDFDQFKKLVFRKDGEKLAGTKEKTAEATVDLDSLFSHSNIVKRERLWKDRTKKKETYRVGSGMGDSFEKAKTAGVVVEPEKVAEYLDALFKTSGEKTADILKEVEPDSTTGRIVEELSSREPKIDSKVLDKAGEKDLQKALATPAMMGMVLKPEEFQRILLSAVGKSDLADELDSKGVTFKPTKELSAPCGELGPEHFDEDLMKDLLPMLDSRSYIGPVLQRRIVVLKITPKVSSSQPEESPLLSKVGAAYTWYRSEMVKCAAHAQQLIENHPAMLQMVEDIDDSSFFTKTAGADANTFGAVATSIPLMLMLSASYRGDEQRGEELGLVKELIAKHPHLSALGVGALIREAMKHPELNKLVGEIASNALGAGKRILVGGA